MLAEITGCCSITAEPARGRFRGWLLTVTRRMLCRFKARQARRSEHGCEPEKLESVEDDRADPEWNEDFDARVLRVALDRIQPHFQPETWNAFEAVWIQNRPAAETAESLSLRIGQVHLAKSRVLKRLCAEVEEIVDDLSWLDTLES